MKLKLCGIRRLEDIGYVNEFPPDYIGFVFAESKRQVSVEQAAALAQSLHPGIQTVGVFVNAPLEHLLQTAERVRLDILQLHGDEDASYIHALRQRTKCPLWKAVRVTNAESIRRAEKLPADLLLLDSFSPAVYGGSGQIANWDAIREAHPQKPFFLAGGLTIKNLSEAIQAVQPAGVDLSGGIETDGCKDREKIRAVVAQFRALQHGQGINQEGRTT